MTPEQEDRDREINRKMAKALFLMASLAIGMALSIFFAPPTTFIPRPHFISFFFGVYGVMLIVSGFSIQHELSPEQREALREMMIMRYNDTWPLL